MRFSFHVAFAILVSAAAICPGPAPAAVFERDFVPGYTGCALPKRWRVVS